MNNTTSTLLDNFEKVVSAAKMYRLNDMFYSVAQESLNELSRRLAITPKQALVFALLLEFGSQRKIFMSSIVKMLECDAIRALSFMNEADALCERGLLVCVKNRDTTYYDIPLEVIDAIRDNRVYEPDTIADLNEAAFYHAMDKIFKRIHSHERALQQALIDLIRANKHIPFVQVLFKRGIMDNCDNNWNVLMACVYAHRLIIFDDDYVGRHDWSGYFQESINIRTINFELENRILKLCRCHLVELARYKGINEDSNYNYHFTDQAKREMFPNHKFLVVKRHNKEFRHN